MRDGVPCRAAWVLAGVLGFASLTACKEDSSLMGTQVVPTPDFVAVSPDPGVTSHYVSIRENGVSGSRITLDVAVTEVSEPVTAIALKISYPKEFVRFAACHDGDLFPSGPCYASETPAAGSGEVLVSRSVQSAAQATPVSGTKAIVRLEFIVFGFSEGNLVFEAQNLGGGDASALLDAQGQPILMHWYAGRFVGK